MASRKVGIPNNGHRCVNRGIGRRNVQVCRVPTAGRRVRRVRPGDDRPDGRDRPGGRDRRGPVRRRRAASWGGSSGWSTPAGRCRPPREAIHGISDADLAGAPPAREVLPEFLAFLGDPETTTLLAHNAAFDAGFLGRELGRLGLPLPGHAVVDTLALARAACPWRDHRLDTLARLLGLDPDGPHRALADSRRVMGLWLALDGPDEPETSLVSYPIFDPRPRPPRSAGTAWSEAIARGLRVRMEYDGGLPGLGAPRDHPGRFAHRGGVAYLVAYCHLDAFEKSFRLDRVRRYEVIS